MHVGLIIVVNLAPGMTAPPVGMNPFAACQVAGLSLARIVPRLVRFVPCAVARLPVITSVPSVSLFFRDLLHAAGP